MSPAICEYCKSEIAADARYCPYCGAEARPPAQSIQPSQVQASAVKGKTTLSMVSFGLALGGIVFGWMLLIAALVIGIVALKREPEGKTYAKIGVGISAGLIALWVIAIVVLAVIASVEGF